MLVALYYPNADENGHARFYDDQDELLNDVEKDPISKFPNNIMNMDGQRFVLEYRNGQLKLEYGGE